MWNFLVFLTLKWSKNLQIITPSNCADISRSQKLRPEWVLNSKHVGEKQWKSIRNKWNAIEYFWAFKQLWDKNVIFDKKWSEMKEFFHEWRLI